MRRIGTLVPKGGTKAEMIEERDIFVAMRDGTRLALDVYRPDKAGRYPVLYAAALHNKDMQGPDVADVLPPQPAPAPLWFGPIEAGNTRLFVANGYAHVIAQPRGSGNQQAITATRIPITTTPSSGSPTSLGATETLGWSASQATRASNGAPPSRAIRRSRRSSPMTPAVPTEACSGSGTFI